MIGTASWQEILWTATAAIGCLFSLLNFANARADLLVARHLRDLNGRRSLALGTMVTETVRVVVQLIFILIGVDAMLLPNRRADHLPPNARLEGYFIEYGLLAAATLLAVQALILYRTRVNVLQHLTHEPQ